MKMKNFYVFVFVSLLITACSGGPSSDEKGSDAETLNDATGVEPEFGEVPEYRVDQAYDLALEPRAPRLADLDGDEFVDLVVVHQFSDEVRLFRGRGDGIFEETTLRVERASFAASGDFDGDGRGDLALGVDGESRVVIVSDLLGAAATEDVTLPDFPDDVVAADFDGDGDDDLAVSIAGTGAQPATSVAIFSNEDGFEQYVSVEVGLQPRQLLVGDVDGDDDIDIVALLGTTAAVVLENDGSGTFAASAPFATGEGVLNATLLDVDADGKLDLASADLTGGAITLALAIPSGDADEFRQVPAPFDLASFSGNGDDLADLVATGVDDAALVGMLSGSDGTYARATFASIGDAVRLGGLAAADFDGDGVDDFAVVERQRDPEPGQLHIVLSGEKSTR